MKIGLFLLGIFMAPSIVFAKECSLAEVYGSCEAVKNSGPILKRNADGTLTPNFYRTLDFGKQNFQDPLFIKDGDELMKQPANRDADQKKFLEKIDKVRKLYLEEILQGRREGDPSLDSTTKIMIQRLKTVQAYNYFDSECESEPTKIAYSIQEHAVMYCASFLRLPEVMQLALLSHELGHVVDPCNLSNPLLKVKQPFTSKGCPAIQGSEGVVYFLTRNAGGYVIPGGSFLTRDRLMMCHSVELVSEGKAEFAKNIAGRNSACILEYEKSSAPLHRNQSYKYFEEQTISELKKRDPDITKEQIQETLKEIPLKETFQDYQLKMATYLQTGSACLANSPPGQFLLVGKAEERGADAMAAKIMARYVSNKTLTPEEKRSVIETQAQIACIDSFPNPSVIMGGFYPTGQERLNLFLQEPAIQKMFNCTYTGERVCSSDTLEAPAGKKTSSEKPNSDSLKGTQ